MIEEFYENIDLECQDNDEISIKAYQLDNKGRGEEVKKGLKTELKVDGIKSTDYFLIKEKKILIIEISDFEKQKDLLQEKYNRIKLKIEKCEDEKKKEDLKFLRKECSVDKILKKEIKTKYLNTLLILTYLDINIKENKKEYLLVFCIQNKSSILMFDILKKNIKSDLQILSDEIKIIPAKELENYLKRVNE